jgi:energy-coupling factor transport system ATP-binding protein
VNAAAAPLDIHVEEVTFTYAAASTQPVTALRSVSLHIPAGDRLALIGQNGAGKTTLAKQFNGLLRPTQGRVLVGDWDTRLVSTAKLARRVGYVFQNPDDQLFKSTLWDEVCFGPQNLGWKPAAVQAAAQAALEQVGLEAAARRHPHDLAPSQRKLAALACVLAMDPPVVLLDEPTTGQDAAGQALLGRIIQDLHAAGKTVIAVTHDMDFCAENFIRVAVMAQGRILAGGPPGEVFRPGDVAHAAELEMAGVDPPQMARLAGRLGLDAAPLTPQELVALLAAQD